MVANLKITDPLAQPIRETLADIQIIVIEQLAQLEQRLKTVTDSQPKTKKAQEKRHREIRQLTHSVENFKAFLTLSEGQQITDGVQLGVIKDLKLSPGGIPEVWVSWYGHVLIPEQPKRLKSEPFFKYFKVGDTITINSKHPPSEQKSFEIKEFRGDGWILTTTNQLFHHDFIELTSLISSESEQDLSSSGTAISEHDGEVVEETINEIVEETVQEIVEDVQEIGSEIQETVDNTSITSEIVDETNYEQSTTEIVESPETSNSTGKTKTPKGISFGKTINQLYQGKTCTRRIWSERTIKTFINYFEQGVKVPAYDKGLQYGGEIIGWLTLTQKPYQDELINMTQADLKAEGFPDYTFDQFINEFFEGKNQTVWVIWFQFSPNQPQENSVTVEVVENDETQLTENQSLTQTEELTDDEARDRLHLERKVERAFYEAGKALYELRERRLYRSSHKTFEDYCQDRFGFGRHAANRLIAGASVVENLVTNGYQNQSNKMVTNGLQIQSEEMVTNGYQNQKDETLMVTNRTQRSTDLMVTNGHQILPTSERQVRPLTNLEPDQQREAWQKAVAAAGGKVPSGSIVKSIVDQIRERTKVPNPWRVGEVASIIVKENPDLRGKGGCWAVITAVHDFSCTVRLWDGEYLVKPEHLKHLPYAMTDQNKNFFSSLGRRLSKLYNPQMEETAKAILSSLGKIDRPWLTELEERLLRVLEGS